MPPVFCLYGLSLSGQMNMRTNMVDPAMVETWVKGWALARETSEPVKEGEAFRIDVGWPDQKTRYVFPFITDHVKQLAETISEPCVFLKVCEDAKTVRQYLPSKWVIEQPRFMMVCDHPMQIKHFAIPKGYTPEIFSGIPVPVVRLNTLNGEEAAIGRIAFVNDHAIYDRIVTHPDHRRKGLATIVMKLLEEIAASRNISKGILVATAEGRALYQKLGWQLYAPYTTAVIPDY